MREFMRKGEHLGSPRVGPIYEYQRRNIVRKCEPAKFFWIEWTIIIVKHHTTAHDHNSSFISLANEVSQSVGPGWNSATLFDIKAQRVAHDRRNGLDTALQARRSNKREWRNSFGSRKVAVPFLALLADINHIEQVGTGTCDGFVS